MSQTTLHTRFVNFTRWIRPDPDKVEEVRKQRDDVKARIKAKAEADGLIVRSMPGSGSYAKATGLRRHMLGDAEHEGQDVDCPFVVAGKDKDGDPLTELLSRFEGYAKACYPDTPLERTKSSVKLVFVASKVSYDLVPMLAVEGADNEQILLRSGGERRRTSLQKHVDFVRSRSKRSDELRGPVAFNDGVRLFKWWREYQVTQSKIMSEIPSFLVELLCAKAFDDESVQGKYPETLVTWFDRIYSYVAKRGDVTFRDFGTPKPELISALWRVIDPVNTENNAVPAAWGGIQVDEIRDWAARARDKLQQAIAFEMRGRDADAVALVADIFGNSFKNHSEE
jgi:hypothetical protein